MAQQVNGLVFENGGQFWDWYTANQVNFGIVVDEFFFGHGKIYKANFAERSITDQEYTREEFNQKVDPQMLQALGLMGSMFLIGYTHAIMALMEAEAERQSEPLILVPQNGKFVN